MAASPERRLIYALLIVAGIGISWGFLGRSTKSDPAPPALHNPACVLQQPAPETALQRFDQITYDLSGSWSSCNSPKVVIRGNGELEASWPECRAETNPPFKGRLSAQQVSKIVTSLNAAGYFELPLHLDAQANCVDRPNTTTTVTAGGETHAVDHRCCEGYSPLENFEGAIRNAVTEAEIDELLPAASGGSAPSQYRLGKLYMNPGSEHYDEAVKWLQMAAGNGSRDAALALGDIYQMPQTGRFNHEEALFWQNAFPKTGTASTQDIDNIAIDLKPVQAEALKKRIAEWRHLHPDK